MTTHSIDRDVIAELLAKHQLHNDGDVPKTEHLICPACDGGKAREKSFVIYYTPAYSYYKCYRGTCGVGDRVANTGPTLAPAERSIKPRNIYYGNFTKIYDAQTEWATAKYKDLHNWARMNLHSNSNDGRLVVTLRNEWMVPWGVELKNWKDIIHFPKSARYYLRYTDVGNQLAWAVDFDDRQSPAFRDLFVTEDAISAYRIRAHTGEDAVALLGTNLRGKDTEKILKQGYTRIRLVLDPDQAGIKGAMKIQQQYAFMFDISMHLLPNDPKNMATASLQDSIRKIRGV